MIVADTHIIIWHALQPELLSQKSIEAIDSANREDGIIFCRISLWEIAMLMKNERLQIEIGYQAFIKLVFQSNRYVYRELSPEIADISTQLPPSINKEIEEMYKNLKNQFSSARAKEMEKDKPGYFG